jgi:hypothetical protein
MVLQHDSKLRNVGKIEELFGNIAPGIPEWKDGHLATTRYTPSSAHIVDFHHRVAGCE